MVNTSIAVQEHFIMAQPIRKTLYRGYQTVGGRKINRLYDTDLIIQGLFNIINTRKTERVRNANYGSILYDMIFELKTDINLAVIYQEVERILKTEPRIRIINININTDNDYEIVIEADLLYIGDENQFSFVTKFDLEKGVIENLSGATNE